MKEVRWTETAKKSLQETSNFILKVWNYQVREDFLDQLEYRINQLQHNPELGVAFANTHYRKLVVHKTVSLFYADKPSYIKILVIWDNRSDPNQLLEKLANADSSR